MDTMAMATDITTLLSPIPTHPTHTLPTTTLSHISMEDAETTKEPWSHVLADK